MHRPGLRSRREHLRAALNPVTCHAPVQRRHSAAVDPTNSVIARVGHVNLADRAHGDTARVEEFRILARAVGKAVPSAASYGLGAAAVEHLTNRMIARVGHVHTPWSGGDAERPVEAHEPLGPVDITVAKALTRGPLHHGVGARTGKRNNGGLHPGRIDGGLDQYLHGELRARRRNEPQRRQRQEPRHGRPDGSPKRHKALFRASLDFTYEQYTLPAPAAPSY